MNGQTAKATLRSLTLDELRSRVRDRGLPDFRYRQIARWLYDKGVGSFDEMTDLSKELRRTLARDFELGELALAARQVSRVDGARKYLFLLEDGARVESVLMPADRRVTLCISSQAGCTLDCVFCQTGRMGFARNLAAHEILGQVVPLWRETRDRAVRKNVVFMGMGEPLHNLEGVLAACRILRDPLGFGLGRARITVSTAGVIPGIRKLADSGVGVRLAVSLNATTQEARERLMPRAARTPLPELVAAARRYAAATGSRVTMEYVLIRGVNDSPEDADRLAGMVRGGPFKINLIPYNPGASPELQRPEKGRVDAFARRLYPQAPVVTVRWSLGPDISAACGQLRAETDPARPPGETPERGGKGPGRPLPEA